MGGAGALSDAAVSDKLWDNYPDIASSKGNFSDQPSGTPTLHPQRAAQFSNPASEDNRAVKLYRLRRKAM
jgi:hypothetical protein